MEKLTAIHVGVVKYDCGGVNFQQYEALSEENILGTILTLNIPTTLN